MVKKNIIGIIMVVLITASFLIGYQMGKGSSDQANGQTGMPSGAPSGMMSGKSAGGQMPSGMPQGNQAPSTGQVAQSKESQVVSAPAEEKLEPVQTFYGTVQPFAEVKIQSEQGGTIIYMKAKEGDVVKKGEVLVKFDTKDKLLELENAKSSLNSSEQQVEQAVSNYNTVQKDYERNKSLFEDGLVSRQDLDNMSYQLQAALTSLQNSRESVSQATTQIRMIENQLEDYQITAAISGVVESKEYNLKEVYKSGDMIYNIINIDQVYAEIEVPETYLQKIKEGMEVSVYFSALGDTEFSGTVETIMPSGSGDSRNFTAKVIVENPDLSIKSGMFARVDVKG